MGVYTERYGKVTRQSVPLFTRCWPVERDSSEPCAVITVIFVQAFGLISENDPVIFVWAHVVLQMRTKERTEAKRKSLCCGKVSCRLICLSLPSPPLSWHPVAVCSDQWSRDRSPLLRAASPLQTLRQMTRCSTDGVAHGIICMRVHTHSLPRTQTPYVHAHLHTEIYTSSWDVLTFPLGLPEMSSPPAAANSPFQPLTLPGAGAVRWSTNDLCAFRLSRLLQSVHPSHISHCLCNYIPLIYCTASPSDCISVYSPPRRYPHLFSIPVRELVPNCVRLQPSTSL